MTVAAPQQPMTAVAAAAAPIAVIVDVAGVSPVVSAASLRERLAATEFCWLDIFGGSDAERNELLRQTGFEEIDITWIQRFGRAGRLTIGQHKLRAVTWLAGPAGKPIEVHLVCSRQRILTLWRGDIAILDNIRQHFVERIVEVGKSRFQATGVLLQLLLTTLDHAIRGLDARLDHLQVQLDDQTSSADFARFVSQREAIRPPAPARSSYPIKGSRRANALHLALRAGAGSLCPKSTGEGSMGYENLKPALERIKMVSGFIAGHGQDIPTVFALEDSYSDTPQMKVAVERMKAEPGMGRLIAEGYLTPDYDHVEPLTRRRSFFLDGRLDQYRKKVQ